jgi:hypothetical protein
VKNRAVDTTPLTSILTFVCGQGEHGNEANSEVAVTFVQLRDAYKNARKISWWCVQ